MIPRTIHYCWFSGEKYPPQIKACIKSWQKNLKGYDIVLWDGKRFDFNSVPFVKQCIEMRKWAFAADYIRLYAVYTMGGIYLDSDVRVLNTFDDLLDDNAFWGIDANEDQQYFFPEAAVFGAVKGFSPLKEMMAFYEQLPVDEVNVDTFTRLTNVCDERNRTVVKPDGSPQLSTAPVVMESVLRKYGYQQTNIDQTLQSGIKIYAEPIIQNSSKVDTPQTIAHHQNASSWFYTDRGPLFKFCYNHPQLMPLYKKVERIRERL